MVIIGMTGGIASGKSTVTGLFSAHGISHVDADQVARDVVAPGQPTLNALVSRYGRYLLMPDGGLDRRALRSIIFASPKERQWVETLMHPAIRARMLDNVHALTGPYALLVVPLLFETALEHTVNRVLVIDIPEALQRARLKIRDNSSDEQIEAILKAQMSRSERLRRADDIIDNSGPRNDPALAARVAELDWQYRNITT